VPPAGPPEAHAEFFPFPQLLEIAELEHKRFLVLNEALGGGEIFPLLHRFDLAESMQLGPRMNGACAHDASYAEGPQLLLRPNQ